MKLVKNAKGFTLIEMLIVLFVIGVLIMIILPNIANVGEEAQETACEANVQMLQAHVDAYYLAEDKYPSINELEDYIGDDIQECPGGEEYKIEEGEVKVVDSE